MNSEKTANDVQMADDARIANDVQMADGAQTTEHERKEGLEGGNDQVTTGINSEEKRQIVKRLAIYYLTAFLPFVIGIPVLNRINSGPIFGEMDMMNLGIIAYCVGVFGMFLPSIAVLVARLVTKEGFRDSYLELNCRGNGKYYVFSILGMPVINLFTVGILWISCFYGMRFGEIFDMEGVGVKFAAILLQLATSVILFFPAFGEEWGWRGYMMPKLTKLLGRPRAILTGGILWGLWHAPLTVSGHNFGTQYAGFPWLGIVLMCVFCTVFNMLLTWLTERTKSIYPASFCHMINNNLTLGALLPLLLTEEAGARYAKLGERFPLAEEFLITTIPMAVVSVVCFVALMKDKKVEIKN